MKKSILTIFLFFTLSFCQIQYGGSPKFLDIRNVNIVSPELDNTIDRDFDPMVFEYGVEYDMDVNVLDQAISIYNDEEVTFLLTFYSKGAYGIGLNFDKFYLTENSKLFLYDINKSYYFGALTSENNKRDNVFSTSIIKGEFLEPGEIHAYLTPF